MGAVAQQIEYCHRKRLVSRSHRRFTSLLFPTKESLGMLDNSVEMIKNQVTMADICRAYGIEINKKGFANCPFHNEKTASFKIYEGERGFYCFGCGKSGDVIDFVMTFFSLTFQEALKKINLDFGLNLFGEQTFEERRQSHFRQKAKIAERERKKAEREAVNRDYWAAFDEWKRLMENRERYKPKSQDDDLHPLFVEALQKLAHQEFLLDLAEERKRNYA